MVKFSKDLEAQLIPEWKEAFVDYWLLKKHVKRIKFALLAASPPPASAHSCSFFHLLLLLLRLRSHPHPSSHLRKGDGVQKPDGDEEALNGSDLSDLCSPRDEIGEFLERLNGELNKVNEFYKVKEDEFLERGQALDGQLQILLQLKQFLVDRRRRNNAVPFLTPETTSLSPPPSTSFSVTDQDIDPGAESAVGLQEPDLEIDPATDDNVVDMSQEMCVENLARWPQLLMRTKKKRARLEGLMIKIPATTPTRAIAALTTKLWEEVLNNYDPKKEVRGDYVTRKKIQYAEKMIRNAFVELYRGLELLKTYSSLNMTAFRKILKKFDKVANQRSSDVHLDRMRQSYFNSSDKVTRLGDEIESVITKYFTDDDRKKAMLFLRPRHRKQSHVITFFIGLFTGSFVALFCVYAFLANIYGTLTSKHETDYVETVYPIFSMFALLSLHIFLYGCNLYFWKRYRINYHFIFEFSPTTALNHRDTFLIATSCLTLVVAAMVLHLFLRSTGSFSSINVDTVPGILLLFFLAMLVCPLNTFYRSSRYHLLRTLRNIACAPSCKVTMVDVFVADQLTSQIPLLRHTVFVSCYYLTRSFKTHEYRAFTTKKIFKELQYLVSFLPFYWRAVQCGRKWYEERNITHIANFGKYVSAVVAALARLTFVLHPTPLWRGLVIFTSIVATFYQLYWDFREDWALFKPRSRNPWLRDELILKKGFYRFSIVLNIALRVVWVVSIFPIDLARVKHILLDFLLASLEIIRRGHWNFYRLENEHVNNVGNFKAVKAVPLPFREYDSDE